MFFQENECIEAIILTELAQTTKYKSACFLLYVGVNF